MKYIWQVEKYLEGEMKGEELRYFELEILRNPDLAKEIEKVRKMDTFSRKQYAKLISSSELVEEYDDLQNIVDESLIRSDLESLEIRKISNNDPEFHDFREKVKTVSFNKEIKEKHKNKVLIPRNVILLAAASFALLLAFSVITLLTRSSSDDLEAVYEKFYEPYQADLLIRDMVTSTDDPYQMGLSEYQQANYGMALTYFNQVSPGSEINNAIYLLKGICYMELQQFDSAIQYFNSLDKDPVLSFYGKWYRGLCYIKLNEPELAKDELLLISEQDRRLKRTVRTFLKSL
jgi:tetratricopeptide (TPR) repeat protein